MNSPRLSSREPLDLLIADVLKERVGDAQPSRDVWYRVNEQAVSWSVRRTANTGWKWSAFLLRRPSFVAGVDLAGIDFDSFEREFTAIRLVGLAGLIFRFAW
jgi:hypothetical protein